ncbi:hypothetical protein EI424_06515 [Tenacibaculum singaporense]|nr:hypothetical protein EI424_06515 [Tenacibaculum singaporense]
MKKSIFLFLSLLLLNQSCKVEKLNPEKKEEIINSSYQVIQQVFEYSNNLDFKSGLNHYSDDPNAFYINDGVKSSLNDLKKSYSEIGPYVEELQNTIESWNAYVLSQDVVVFTLQVKLKFKLKEKPEMNKRFFWTATVQKQNESWVIVQSHDSNMSSE